MSFNAQSVDLRVADTWQKRLKGLLGTQTMTGHESLWIRPCKAVHTFGMRFDLSVYFLDRSGRIIVAHPRVCPGRMLVCLTAHSVIEQSALQASESLELRIDQLQRAVWSYLSAQSQKSTGNIG